MRAQAEDGVPVGGAAGADHAGSRLVCELDGDRADRAGGAVDQDGLPGDEAGVVEQALPGGQSGDRQCGCHRVVDVGGERGEVAGFHGDVLGERAVAGPVGQSEDALSDGEAGRSVAEFRHHARYLVAGHARGAVAAGAVGPARGPVELSSGESRGVHPQDDVVLGGVGMGQVFQGQSHDPGFAVPDGDGSHGQSLRGVW